MIITDCLRFIILLAGLLEFLPLQINGQEANRCVWYDDCGGIPCVNNGASQPLTNQQDQEILKELCPNLYTTNPVTCCSAQLLANMAAFTLRFAQQNLQRCPACMDNLLNHFCQITCSPNQTQFVNVTNSVFLGNNKFGVINIDVYLTNDYAYGIHNSCKNVLYPAFNGIKVSDIMCPNYPGENCTPTIWFNLLYTTASTGYITNYVFVDSNQNFTNGVEPLSSTPLLCQNPAFGKPACNCEDCPDACKSESPKMIIPAYEPLQCGKVDCKIVILIIVFIVFYNAFILYVCISSTKRLNTGGIRFNFCDTFVKSYNNCLSRGFEKWGKLVAKHPCIVLLISVILVAVCSGGIYYTELVTDPVELWSNSDGQTRKDKRDFEDAFRVSSRVEQIFITPHVQNNTIYNSYANGPLEFSALFNLEIFEAIFQLQYNISQIRVPFDNGTLTLEDVCEKPNAPQSNECLITSVLQYWQNKLNRIKISGSSADFRDHFIYCAYSPFASLSFPLNIPCSSSLGDPTLAYTILDGYQTMGGVDQYNTAEAFVLTFYLKNDDRTIEFERAFIEFMRTYDSPLIKVSFLSELSLDDELEKQSQFDVENIGWALLALFLYMAIALGQYNKCSRILVDINFVLSLTGIAIVLLSITSSIGIYGYLEVKANVIVIRALPFFIAAVGANGIFILVKDYQMIIRQSGETREEHIGRAVGRVAPGILVCGISEFIAFFSGTFLKIDGINTFALYAGLARLFLLILQMFTFVAVLSLDAWRQEACKRLCCTCCSFDEKNEPEYLKLFMKKIYAPIITNIFVSPLIILKPSLSLPWVALCRPDPGFKKKRARNAYTTLQQVLLVWYSETKVTDSKRRTFPLCPLHEFAPVMVIVFVAATFVSVCLTTKLPAMLDRADLLDSDSYAVSFARDFQNYGEIGAKVYFVVEGQYDYSSEAAQNMICGGPNCSCLSLNQKLASAAENPENLIAFPVNSWLDDYFDWIGPNPASCCKLHSTNTAEALAGDYCPTTDSAYQRTCSETCIDNTRPTSQFFYEYLPKFLKTRSDAFCDKVGDPFYNQAVSFHDNDTIQATYFRTYHTKPGDGIMADIDSLKITMKLCEEIEDEIRKNVDVGDDFRVYAYSQSYIYNEQFLDIAERTIIILLCMAVVMFIIHYALTLDMISSIIVVVNLAMIVVETMGIMYLLDIPLNEISLFNLMIATGISVEFISYIVITSRQSTLSTRKQRVEFALATAGSSIFSGVTLAKLLPIIVAFSLASSELFRVYYFGMYIVITLIGTLHGLVFLPALLVYIGPMYEDKSKKSERMENVRLTSMNKSSPGLHHRGHDNKVESSQLNDDTTKGHTPIQGCSESSLRFIHPL